MSNYLPTGYSTCAAVNSHLPVVTSRAGPHPLPALYCTAAKSVPVSRWGRGFVVGTSGVDASLSEPTLLLGHNGMTSTSVERPDNWSWCPVPCKTASSLFESSSVALADEAIAAAIEAPAGCEELAAHSTDSIGVSGDDASSLEDQDIGGCNNVEPHVPGNLVVFTATDNPFPGSSGEGSSLRAAEALWAMSCEELTTLARCYERSRETSVSQDRVISNPNQRINSAYGGSDRHAVSPSLSAFAPEDYSHAEGILPEPRHWNISGAFPHDVETLQVLDGVGAISMKQGFSASHGCFLNLWLAGAHTIALPSMLQLSAPYW
ncbi:hypothetical protein B0H14DRAFT_3881686 [Mycena olivaceomarginata]|nr:hypothetical protein B0H14DRAFT_3881686 [Mycena olivaceomarginata]